MSIISRIKKLSTSVYSWVLFQLRNFRERKWFILLCCIHSCFLIFLTFFILNSALSFKDEDILIQATTILKRLVLKIDDKPNREEFLFVNVSYDNKLISKFDEDGYQLGNQVITDRAKLAKFLKTINKAPKSYKFIVCDIFFEETSQDDSLLQSEIIKTKNIIIPSHLGEDRKVKNPIFNVETGFADYTSVGNNFLKFQLLQFDTVKTLPLRMYEIIHNGNFEKRGLLHWLNNRPSFNSIIIDFRIRNFDLMYDNSEDSYAFINLGESFPNLPDSLLLGMIKGKIILIGDFLEKDIHQTVLGDMSGTLILLNVYLTLLNGESLITFSLILFLFVSYFLASLNVFMQRDRETRKVFDRALQNRIGRFFTKYLGYVLYLAVISTILYFSFNIHINILFIGIYLNILNFLVNYHRKKKAS